MLNIDKLIMIMDAERTGLPGLDDLKLFISDHIKGASYGPPNRGCGLDDFIQFCLVNKFTSLLNSASLVILIHITVTSRLYYYNVLYLGLTLEASKTTHLLTRVDKSEYILKRKQGVLIFYT